MKNENAFYDVTAAADLAVSAARSSLRLLAHGQDDWAYVDAAYQLLRAAQRVCENAAAELDPDADEDFMLHGLVMGRYAEAGMYAARLLERAEEDGHTIAR